MRQFCEDSRQEVICASLGPAGERGWAVCCEVVSFVKVNDEIDPVVWALFLSVEKIKAGRFTRIGGISERIFIHVRYVALKRRLELFHCALQAVYRLMISVSYKFSNA